MGGVQLAQGGLGNRISSLASRGANAFLNYNRQQQEINRTKPLNQLVQNRVIDPLKAVPQASVDFLDNSSNLLFGPRKGEEEGYSALNSGKNAGINLLQVLGGMSPIDPVDAAMAAYDTSKSALAGNDILKGFTGEENTSLGEAFPNGMGDPNQALDMAELPLIIGSILATGKGADMLTKRGDDLASSIKKSGAADDFAGKLPPGSKKVIYGTPDGGLIKPKVNPKTGASLDTLLKQADEAIPGGTKKVTEPVESLLSGEKLRLASGENRVTLAQLKKLKEQGSNLDEVTFMAKNADEAREAIRMGFDANKIEMPPSVSKGRGTFKFPQEEDALFREADLPQPGTKKGFFGRTKDNLIKPSKNVIRDSGESGERIIKTIDKSELESSLKTGEQQVTLKTALDSLSKEEKATFADVTQGITKPVSENQAAAVKVWKDIADDIRVRANNADLEVGKLDDYFPHSTIKGDGSSLFKDGLPSGAERRYGNLELTRQTDLPYDKDPTVLFRYIDNANRRISDVEHFGADDRILYNLANNASKEGGDSVQVTKMLDQMLNKNQTGDFANASRTVRNVQTFKLGVQSAMTNLTQNLSTLYRTDPGTMTKTIKNIISDPKTAVNNAIKAGEIDAAQGARILSDVGEGKVVRTWLKMVGFTGAENVNRIVSVNAGIEYSNKMIKQAKNGSEAAIRELDRLGFDTKSLDKIDPLLGGKKISEATQFSTKTGELPYGWQTPVGRMVTQFKGFAYKHTSFLAGETKRIYQEVKHGNFKPLVNFLATTGIAAPITGEIILDIKSVINNKKRDDEGAERYFNNIMGATSLGLLDNISGFTGKYGPGGVVSAIGGPAAGDIYKGADTIANINSENEWERNRAIRNVTRSIPGFGTTLSNTVVPNSYVDNFDIGGVNLGTNVGLGKKDKELFENIQDVDPEQADLFRDRTQDKREEKKKEGGFLNNLLGNKDTTLTPPSAGVTGTERKDFITSVNDVLDEGVTPSSESIKYAVFDNKSATSNSIEERMDVYKDLNTRLNNENYSEEQKEAFIEASGASKEEATYYSVASKDTEVKLQEMLPKLDAMDNDELVTYLMQGRRIVAGKQMVTSTMLTYLYEKDYISEAQKKAIKALRFDEIENEFYFEKSYGSSGRLTYKQALAAFKIDLPKYSELKSFKNLNNMISGQSTSQTSHEGEMILEDILKG